MTAHPVFQAVHRRQIPDDLLRAMAIAEHLALQQFERGTASAVDLADLRDGLGIAVELARRAGIGAEVLPLLLRAEAVLREAVGGPESMRVQGDGLQVLREAVEAAQQQRRVATLGEFRRASEQADEGRG